MKEKIVFSPGRCEFCHSFSFYRTNWFDIQTSFHGGHGYKVCKECSIKYRPMADDHGYAMALTEILFKDSISRILDWKTNKWLDRDGVKQELQAHEERYKKCLFSHGNYSHPLFGVKIE